VVVGDPGTFAGLRADQYSRVLDQDGHPIPGLYAARNDLNSIMGGNYPGGGITLGPALTFGYIAAKHLAQRGKDTDTAVADGSTLHSVRATPRRDGLYDLDCESALTLDPSYCLIWECYPDGANAAGDPMLTDRPRQVAFPACSTRGAVGGSGLDGM
jgi:hypothetical protein